MIAYLDLFKDNDCRFILEGARKADGSYHDGTSTGEVRLMDVDDVDLLGTTWPKALVYEGPNGRFRADLPRSITENRLAERYVGYYAVLLTAADGKRYADKGAFRVRWPSGL